MGGDGSSANRGERRKKQKEWDNYEGGSDGDGGGSEDNGSISSGGTPDSDIPLKGSRAHMAVMALMDLPMADDAKRKKRSSCPPIGVSSCVVETCGWASKVVRYVHDNGQELLSQVCGRYKLAYDGVLSSIPETMHEQIAHCLLYNPSLFKNGEGIPVGIRECRGVDNFHIQFLQDADSIVRHIRVSCMLSGEPFLVQLRACSNCGSCFSGRFMDVGAHQRAGGWKEITERISAGKHSWSDLKGWRMCVPCFVNWGVKGSTDNSKRASIPQVLQLGLRSVSISQVDGSTTDPSSGGGSSGSKKRKSPASPSPAPSSSSRPKTSSSSSAWSPRPERQDAEPARQAPASKSVAAARPKWAGVQCNTPPPPRNAIDNAAAGEVVSERDASTPEMTWAAARGKLDEVVRLLKAGASVAATDRSGRTCLHLAAGMGHAAVVSAIVASCEVGVLMLKDKEGKTCLHRAADSGSLEATRVLCDKGGRQLVLSQARTGQTCLHSSACGGHAHVVGLLLERGGQELMVKRDEIGATCLHWAVDAGHVEVAMLLARKGGLELMVVQDVVGKTCLHRAVDEGFKEVAEALADLGSKELLLVKDGDNQTCVNWAVELGRSDIAQMLLEKGLRWFSQSSEAGSKSADDKRREIDLARREKEVARREKLIEEKEAAGRLQVVQCKACSQWRMSTPALDASS